MVASLADAADTVSEAWARWCAIDQSSLESPEAWLTTVPTRLGIDRLRSSRRDRERYVGPWLPEPVVTEPGPEHRAELADSLTLGFSTVLDRLEPVERAGFMAITPAGRPATGRRAACGPVAGGHGRRPVAAGAGRCLHQ